MKHLLAILLFLSAPTLQAQEPAAGIPDILYRRNGGIVSGEIIETDREFIAIQVQLSGGRSGVISIPRHEIDRVTFSPNPEQETFLAEATFDDLPKLLALWNNRRALMGLEGSDAASIGLALARVLRSSPYENQREEALDLYRYLEDNATLLHHVSDARQGRLRSLIALDRADEAVAEADALLQKTEDPAVLIESKFVLAEAARRDFESLIEEHPRWEEDVHVRPERHRLYHRIVDLYLFPFLFHGSEQEATARSLGRLLTFLESTSDIVKARHIATDLITLYPTQAAAQLARGFLEQHPPPPAPSHAQDT